jgi:hypothetical protein
MIRSMSSYLKYIIFVLILAIFLLLCLVSVFLFNPGKSNIEEKMEYERIISLFDQRPCWMDICPGVTNVDKARKQISLNFDMEKNEVTYWGNNSIGGAEWFIDPKIYYSKSSISW